MISPARPWRVLASFATIALAATSPRVSAATSVPSVVKQPGTQPGEVSAATFIQNNQLTCSGCHDGQNQPRDIYPYYTWLGSMEAHAGRDPVFWSAMAIAEQDVLPGPHADTRGGIGNLCLRCHTGVGWLKGDAGDSPGTSTNGSSLHGVCSNHISQSCTSNANCATGACVVPGVDGVECYQCHHLVSPDPAVPLPCQTGSPTTCATSVTPSYPPVSDPDADGTLDPHFGSAQYAFSGISFPFLGPYVNAPGMAAAKSPFHRQGEFCGTCHDVSNPVVGNLALSHGAQPGAPNVLADGNLDGNLSAKAAFRNPPARYGKVERTFSEWKASLLGTDGPGRVKVSDYPALPALGPATGAFGIAYAAANRDGNTNYADGDVRYFTCQTCHMPATQGYGCNDPDPTQAPLRPDIPRHDLAGAGYWSPDAMVYLDGQGRLRLGGGLTQDVKDAISDAKARAKAMLQSAASLDATKVGDEIKIRVTNLTGHMLPTGYPEGRRMWINVKWLDAAGNSIANREIGAYGPIGRTVIDPVNGLSYPVQSLIDPGNTIVYETKQAMTKEWAAALLGTFGYDPGMVLTYDRITDATVTLGSLAASPPGTKLDTFHFALNDATLTDDRIPPYGFGYDEARKRNALPEPPCQFGYPCTAGVPTPGGTYENRDERLVPIPAGAVRADVTLYYQQASWEYIQFLWKQNDKAHNADGSPGFLSNEGDNILDAWLRAIGTMNGQPDDQRMSLPLAVQSMEICACSDNDPCTLDSCTGTGAATTCTFAPITAPTETQNLAAASDKATYSWSAAAFATQYDVVRGRTGTLPVGASLGDEVCFNDLADPTLADPGLPAPGTAFWYLSRGENACGIGTFGTRSGGSPRTTTTCP